MQKNFLLFWSEIFFRACLALVWIWPGSKKSLGNGLEMIFIRDHFRLVLSTQWSFRSGTDLTEVLDLVSSYKDVIEVDIFILINLRFEDMQKISRWNRRICIVHLHIMYWAIKMKFEKIELLIKEGHPNICIEYRYMLAKRNMSE